MKDNALVSKSVKNIRDRFDRIFYEDQGSTRSLKIQKRCNEDYIREKNEEMLLKRKRRMIRLTLSNDSEEESLMKRKKIV